MRTGFSPCEQGGNILFPHTLPCLLDRSSGLDNRAKLLRAKLQFNWEVSLAPGQHIQKQTQWGHLSYAAHTNPPLIHPHTAIPPPYLQFQRPTVGKWVLSNQFACIAAQPAQTGGWFAHLRDTEARQGYAYHWGWTRHMLLDRKSRFLSAAWNEKKNSGY